MVRTVCLGGLRNPIDHQTDTILGLVFDPCHPSHRPEHDQTPNAPQPTSRNRPLKIARHPTTQGVSIICTINPRPETARTSLGGGNCGHRRKRLLGIRTPVATVRAKAVRLVETRSLTPVCPLFACLSTVAFHRSASYLTRTRNPQPLLAFFTRPRQHRIHHVLLTKCMYGLFSLDGISGSQ